MKEPLSLCNERTFRETYEKYSKGLYRFLYFSYGDQEKSEDIAQEVFAKLWQRCSEFHAKNIKSLIFTMGKNLMLNEIQKAKVKLNFQSENISYESAPSPEFELEEREFEIRLNDAINQLTVNEREVFLLNRIEQFTYAEIADRLELSQKAIEKRMHSALKKLQHELNISLKKKVIMKEENYLAKWAEGTLSDKELSKLEPKQDPVLLKKILSTTASATIEIPKTLNYENLKSRTSNDKSKDKKGFVLQLAAAVVTIILASSIYFNSEVSITSQSGIEKITLPDDSEVTLMPGSELIYKRSYGWLSRGIEFSGEGIFEVAKGNPFTVNTSNGTVEVLGTVFRVISNSSMPFSVSCLEGKVKVQDQYILTANQHYNESRKEVEDVTDMKAFLSDEGIYYYQVPLSQVIQILERYMEIEIKEDFNQEFVFTGILPIYELESALQSISLPFNLTITKLDELTYRIND